MTRMRRSIWPVTCLPTESTLFDTLLDVLEVGLSDGRLPDLGEQGFVSPTRALTCASFWFVISIWFKAA